MKTISALLLSGLAAIFLSSCVTVAEVPVNPECTPPTKPALPTISRGDMWDAYVAKHRQAGLSEQEAVREGDREYRRVEEYITRLTGYSNAQGAMLGALCSPATDRGQTQG